MVGWTYTCKCVVLYEVIHEVQQPQPTYIKCWWGKPTGDHKVVSEKQLLQHCYNVYVHV